MGGRGTPQLVKFDQNTGDFDAFLDGRNPLVFDRFPSVEWCGSADVQKQLCFKVLLRGLSMTD